MVARRALSRSPWTPPFGRARELTGRRPTLLLRLPGSFLLRFAARQFLALLFQEPPRLTRLEPCFSPRLFAPDV